MSSELHRTNIALLYITFHVRGIFFWTLMHYGQYKQVALRHQAKLVTRGAHHRFWRVNIIADKEKDNVTKDN